MAYSRVVAEGDGTTTQFAVNFALDYLLEADVTCRVGNEVDGSGDPIYRAITFLSTNLIQVGGAIPGDGVQIVFERTVDKDVLRVDYNNGDQLDEDNLMIAQKQAMMAVHEVLDGRFSVLTEDLDAGGFSVINLRDPVDDEDAATKQYVDAQDGAIATAAATAASVSAAASAASAAAAATSAAQGGNFIQSGTGAVTRTMQDKARERVHVKDFGAKCDAVQVTVTASITSGTTALTATGASFAAGDVGKLIIIPGANSAGGVLYTFVSAVADATHITLGSPALSTLSAVSTAIVYGTDDTAAVQKTVNYLIPCGGSAGLSGKVLITAPIVVDYTANTQIIGLQNTTVNFHGDGSGNSQLLHAGFTGPALSYLGKDLSGSLTTKHLFEGFSIQAAIPGLGDGMWIDNAAYATFVDVAIFSMSSALVATDLLTSSFHGCAFLFGVRGISLSHANFSRPNAVSFHGCSIGGFNQFGLSVTGGTAITFFGGSLERNGVFGTGTRYAVLITDAGVEGGTAFAAYGLHVEANVGLCDFLFNLSTTDPSLIVFDGCNIQRGAGLKTTNNILVQQNNATTGKVNLVCRSSFRHFAGYTPVVGEDAIKFISDAACEYDVDVSGSYFGSNLYRWAEATQTPHAMVRITGATGAKEAGSGVKSVVRNSAGYYTITLRNALRSTLPIVQCLMTTAGLVADFGATSTTTVNIKCFTSAGVATDPTWVSVVIYDA